MTDQVTLSDTVQIKAREAFHKSSIRPSVPGPGRTIWASVNAWAGPLSLAYYSIIKSAEEKGLQREIAARYRLTYNPIIPVSDGFSLQPQQAVKLASSALLSIWMLHRVTHTDERAASLVDAERWFLKGTSKRVPGVSGISGWLTDEYLQPLLPLSYGEDFIDLFPYILEIFDVLLKEPQVPLEDFLNESKRGGSHLIKRRSGIFYTPSDVTEYISREALNLWVESNREKLNGFSCLDPACGTGAFLLALLREIRSHYSSDSFNTLDTAINSLYGMDISPQAVQSCAFVILSECLRDIYDRQIPIWHAWQAIRGNFAIIDSTLIKGTGKSEGIQGHRMEIRQALLNPRQKIKPQWFDYNISRDSRDTLLGLRLGDLFEETSQGFTFVISNPPYSKMPSDSWSKQRENEFVTAGSGNMYTFFVEMMWRFTKKNNAVASMIVPLSIAYHSGKAFKALRRAIQTHTGEWTFLFFDRTPDSIFGDDIKTRNAIVFFKHASMNTIKSSQLIRWNSRNRSFLFNNIQTQSIHSAPIDDLIPKIGSKEELTVYQTLLAYRSKLGVSGENLPLSLLPPLQEDRNRCVYFYQTAYNWLPILRSIPMLPENGISIPKSIRGLIFDNEKDAKFFFSTASSRISYWLWRVEGDGFHLTNNFLMRLPFSPDVFSNNNIERLEELADILWTRLQQYPIVSRNAGQKILNYCPYRCTSIIDEIDNVIIDEYNLNHDFSNFLKKFVANNIIVERENEPKFKEILQLLSQGAGTG